MSKEFFQWFYDYGIGKDTLDRQEVFNERAKKHNNRTR